MNTSEDLAIKISNATPLHVKTIAEQLENAGFEAHLVGGSLRDVVMGKTPSDWDIATDATPNQVSELFIDTYQENDLGTVGVKVSRENFPEFSDEPTTTAIERKEVVEITTYRSESTYSNNRHPDKVVFETSIEKDLARRDFTCNAMAYSFHMKRIIDPFNGLEDISRETIRAVGRPEERFNEDALRLLRTARFQAQLQFSVAHETLKALETEQAGLKSIAVERIWQEFSKLLDAPGGLAGLYTLYGTNLLRHIIPELYDCVGIEQGGVHVYDVFEHLLRSYDYATQERYPFHVKLAALLHDIGKPATRQPGKSKEFTFYNHEVVGATIAFHILERLKTPLKVRKQVTKLIRWHMFAADPDNMSLTAVRRLLAEVGQEMMQDLIKLRMADRAGMGRPVILSRRLKTFIGMVDEVLYDPVSVKDLAINGHDLQSDLSLRPGKDVGDVLHVLLHEVLLNPSLNTKETLLRKAKELLDLSPVERQTLAKTAVAYIYEHKKQAREELYKKHGVKPPLSS